MSRILKYKKDKVDSKLFAITEGYLIKATNYRRKKDGMTFSEFKASCGDTSKYAITEEDLIKATNYRRKKDGKTLAEFKASL